MNKYVHAVKAITSAIQHGTSVFCVISNDTIQYSEDDIVASFGLLSGRFIIYSNDRDASITIQPADLSMGTFVKNKGIEISVFSTTLSQTYDTLYIGSGELFQLETLYDYDFTSVRDIVTALPELYKAYGNSPKYMSNHGTVDIASTAVQNIEEAVQKYLTEDN